MKRLNTIFNESEDVAEFIREADNNGYGLWSIRDILRDNDIDLTEEEIDELR